MKHDYPARPRRGFEALPIHPGAIISSRDTFALLFALPVMLGPAMVALSIFAVGATTRMLFVIHSLSSWHATGQAERSA